MLNEFTVGFRNTEEEMDFMVPLSMSAEGVGSALFVLSFLFGSRAGALGGLALVCAGAAALFLHLGHPLRFWRVISKAPTAWISRGAVFTGGLIVIGILTLLLPRDSFTGVGVQALALLCALIVMIYTGLLYASMASVPFWSTALLPLSFLLHSLTSGAMVLMGFLSFSGARAADFPNQVAAAMALLLVSSALTWLCTQPAARSAAIEESIRRLTAGQLKVVFVRGAVLAGLVAPVALLALAYWIAPGARILSAMLLFVAMLSRLAGDMAFRSAVLRAGVYEPVI
ncbi:MAG: DmsC/YnfH family molybdoenzyme membrane anchor subunit [bacterium]